MRIATIPRLLCVATVFALSLSVILSSGVLAQYHPGIKVAFHSSRVSKSPCPTGADLAAQSDCATYETSGFPLDTPHYVYVVVAGIGSAGFSGAEFRIAYDEALGSGVDILDWMTCGTLEFPQAGPNGAWPSSGSANRIFWSGCQQTVPSGGDHSQALAGVFLVTAGSDDVLRATPNRTGVCYGELKVFDCGAGVLSISARCSLGKALI